MTVEDFIFPIFKNLTPKQVTWMNMGLSKLWKKNAGQDLTGVNFCNFQEKWSGKIHLKQKTSLEMGVKIPKHSSTRLQHSLLMSNAVIIVEESLNSSSHQDNYYLILLFLADTCTWQTLRQQTYWEKHAQARTCRASLVKVEIKDRSLVSRFLLLQENTVKLLPILLQTCVSTSMGLHAICAHYHSAPVPGFLWGSPGLTQGFLDLLNSK